MEGPVNVINFVFEDLKRLKNFINCTDINKSTITRFGPSVIVSSITNRNNIAFNNQLPNKFIIASGVNHHPEDWSGPPWIKESRTSVLDNLNPSYLDSLREGRALLLLDQSLEGYQTPWLWEYFHNDCKKHKVNPQSIVYVTGNLLSDTQYQSWADELSISNRLKVIPYIHFEKHIQHLATFLKISPSFEDTVEYKTQNLKNLKVYNCLQKRQRVHRSWFYLYLFIHKILDYGLVSTNHYGNHIPNIDGIRVPQYLLEEGAKLLPLIVNGEANNIKGDHHYINRILDNVCLDTWVSIVSEASFVDSEDTLFLSEKVFKPIACMHPFIVLGNKDSLKRLRDMGYKTFDGFIDERYDSLPTFERFDAIISSIKQIIAIEDKVSWYKSMQPILEHNYNVLHSQGHRINPACSALINYYNEYFKEQ
jgi:hypothetical protein